MLSSGRPLPTIGGAVSLDEQAMADLVEFARIERDSGDIEPWAAILRYLYEAGMVDRDEALWLVKLYNAYDSLGSAWGVFERWGSPPRWAAAPDRDDAADFPCTQERRGLRGGRVLKHLDSYVTLLAGRTQEQWLSLGLTLNRSPQVSFTSLVAHTRAVWGVGRQTSFEWVEFLGKVVGFPVKAGHGFLWESEGPRRSLQRIFGDPNPSPATLDVWADVTRAHLAAEGVPLTWEDFETVICDFNVMRDGRYYPGRHLAAIREEVDGNPILEQAFHAIVPVEWSGIAPGIDKAKMPVYRDTGTILRSAA